MDPGAVHGWEAGAKAGGRMKSKSIPIAIRAAVAVTWLTMSACTANIGTTWMGYARRARRPTLFGSMTKRRASRLALRLLQFRFQMRRMVGPCVAESRLWQSRQAWRKF